MMGEIQLACLLTNKSGEIDCNGTIYYLMAPEGEERIEPTNILFWVYLLVYAILVLFAGLMSGLTMGLLSLDIMSLEVLKRGGKPKEKKYSSRIINIIKRHHLLLVTLLLANAVAVESMPIFLNKITNEIVAIIVSVTAVLLFGEILPQALCTRFGLAIGYYCAPLVYILMAMFFIIAFPIAKLLDLILGKGHGTFFRRAELKELVSMHGGRDKENEEPLTYDEVLIVQGALDMRDKTVKDAMTPLESVFMLHEDDKIGHANMEKIITHGHSRIPVYGTDRTDIKGVLLVKKMIKLDPDDDTPISEIHRSAMIPPPSCSVDTALYDILNQFQTGRSHLYLAYDESEDEPKLVGIITLEDVIEELIGEEIVDETDLYVDVHKRIAVARARVNFCRHQASDPSGTTRKGGRHWFSRSLSQTDEISRPVLDEVTIHSEVSTTTLSEDTFISTDDTAPLLINTDIQGQTNL